MWGKEDVHISAWDSRDNIRSVILDWRERSSGLTSKGRDPLVFQADLSPPRVCSPAVELLHKKGPRHGRKICASFLWLDSYYTQSSLTKDKNINYILINLRVLHCLSNGSIYDSTSNYTTICCIIDSLILIHHLIIIYLSYRGKEEIHSEIVNY